MLFYVIYEFRMKGHVNLSSFRNNAGKMNIYILLTYRTCCLRLLYCSHHSSEHRRGALAGTRNSLTGPP